MQEEIEQALARGEVVRAQVLQENYEGKYGKPYEGSSKFDRDTGRQHIIAETREHFLEKEYKDPFKPQPSPSLVELLTLGQLNLGSSTKTKFSFYCPVHFKDLEGYPELTAIHTKTGRREDQEEFLVGKPCGDYVFKLERMWCQGGNDSNLCESQWVIRVQQ